MCSPIATAIFVGSRACFTCGRSLVVLRRFTITGTELDCFGNSTVFKKLCFNAGSKLHRLFVPYVKWLKRDMNVYKLSKLMTFKFDKFFVTCLKQLFLLRNSFGKLVRKK